MNEWGVVTVLIALVGLFFSIGKPIIDLNSNIVKLNTRLEEQSRRQDLQDEALKEQKTHAHESHKELWAHNKEQDEKLSDHDRRIERLEEKE